MWCDQYYFELTYVHLSFYLRQKCALASVGRHAVQVKISDENHFAVKWLSSSHLTSSNHFLFIHWFSMNEEKWETTLSFVCHFSSFIEKNKVQGCAVWRLFVLDAEIFSKCLSQCIKQTASCVKRRYFYEMALWQRAKSWGRMNGLWQAISRVFQTVWFLVVVGIFVNFVR